MRSLTCALAHGVQLHGARMHREAREHQQRGHAQRAVNLGRPRPACRPRPSRNINPSRINPSNPSSSSCLPRLLCQGGMLR